MRQSRIKAKLQQDKPALITLLHFTDPSLFEMVGMMGFDGIWMDMEHHGYGLAAGLEMIRGARAGGTTDIVARPAKGEFMRMGRMLEAGAQGIMYPRCDNAQEAAEVVRWAKFAPQGERGIDMGNADCPYLLTPLVSYLEKANQETLIVIQIEHEQALDDVEAILAIDGVDVIMLGPADFSVLSGVPGQFTHPKILDAKKRIAKAARAAGKHWGCPSFGVDDTKQLLDLGARFICRGSDIGLVQDGLRRIQEEHAPLGFTFEDQFTA